MRPVTQTEFSLIGGIDALGRVLPQASEVRASRPDRFVGLFYILWNGQHGTNGPYDISRIMAESPEALHDPKHPRWGPEHAYHFWGEPLFGFYLADDPWVLRRHMQLLTLAQIDFLVFDTTNAVTYKNVYDVLFPIMEELRWEWPNEPQKTNGFPWIEFVRPQPVYRNEKGGKEVVSVSVAQHPSVLMSDTPFYHHGGNWGRSFHDGTNDESADALSWGYNIAEQWEVALQEDPAIVFLTGWNEWVAMRLRGMAPERPIRFVDQATPDFSRDIEPMKGGYGDSYYMQMIGYIRRFKGMAEAPEASEPCPIRLDGPFSQWQAASVEYRDFSHDTEPRRHPGYGDVEYADDSGRNDFVQLKVAHDAEAVYFYARTAEPITSRTGEHWMQLLIGVAGSASPNWEGYSFILNRQMPGEASAKLERSTGGWQWEDAGEVTWRMEGCELHIAVPRLLLGLPESGTPFALRFKWADHVPLAGDAMAFYLYGDTAPDGRLSYLYRAKS